MVRPRPSSSLLLGAVLTLAFSALLPRTGSPAGAPAVELAGEYRWGRNAGGPLAATFTAAGGDRWDVEFRFTFNGDRHRWQGSAQGSLEEGPLAGTVHTGGRTFRFWGRSAGGVFHGRHAEVYDEDDTDDTGTLELRPPG